MDQWQNLLANFLRNKCSAHENKMVYYALRDGLIDDEFRNAVDMFLNDPDNFMKIDDVDTVPDEILQNISLQLLKQDNNHVPAESYIQETTTESEQISKRHFISNWLKIAATVIITLSVSWFAFQLKTSEEPVSAMHNISVPAGQSVNLTLADGTNIWLNARTTLKYPSVFTGGKREVILDGEGYFDVAYNSDKPFTVQTGEYEIVALGTQFNVEAYSKEKEFMGSLFTGSIKITSKTDTMQTIVLQPNMLAQLHEGRLIADTITDFNHYRWREGLICFKDMPFIDLMSKFEKCYGVKIIVQNANIKKYTPTGKFRHSDGIDYALRVLQRDFKFRFERDDEKQVIYIK